MSITTEEVRLSYAWCGYDEGGEPQPHEYAEFDEWFDGVIVKAKAQALRELAAKQGVLNSTAKWLLEEAEKIEGIKVD